MKTKLHGPYKILEHKDTVNYRIETPDRRSKSTWRHVNMLRPYCTGDSRFNADTVPSILTCHIEQSGIKDSDTETIVNNRTTDEVLLNDFNDFIYNGQEQSETCHECSPDLAMEHQDLNCVFRKFESLFRTKPGLTNLGTYKIRVKPDITPVKCHPYRIPPDKEK